MQNMKNIDFEIAFYEALLEKAPDFLQALIALGEAYTKKGMFEKGLEVDQKLRSLMPLDEVVHYNLACDYALLKDSDQGLRALEKAIVLGYRDFRYMESDDDLAFLRADLRFRVLLDKYRRNNRRAINVKRAS
jgi:tetratricopeptide (TPR) repeat protein